MAYWRRGLIWGFTVFIWLIVYIQLFPSLLPIGHIFFDSFGHLLPHLFQHHSTNLTLFPMGYKLWEGGNCVYVFHQGHVLLIICATIFVLFSLSLHSKSNCSFRRGKKRGQNDQFRPSLPPWKPPCRGQMVPNDFLQHRVHYVIMIWWLMAKKLNFRCKKRVKIQFFLKWPISPLGPPPGSPL